MALGGLVINSNVKKSVLIFAGLIAGDDNVSSVS